MLRALPKTYRHICRNKALVTCSRIAASSRSVPPAPVLLPGAPARPLLPFDISDPLAVRMGA